LTADAMQDDRFRGGDSVLINQIRSVLCVPIQDGPSAMGAFYAVNASIARNVRPVRLGIPYALAGSSEPLWVD